MPYINAAQISGKLGKDAETMTTQGGRTVTRFSIASNQEVDGQGQQDARIHGLVPRSAMGQPHQVRQLTQKGRSGPGPGRAAHW
jgi:hypothetical protein